MKMGTTGRWCAIGSIVLVAALLGCNTEVIPASGPVGTEVCFDPMPETAYQYGGPGGVIDCGWWVAFQHGLHQVRTYTWEECIPVPEEFSPGDDLRIVVTGDIAQWYFKCNWIDYLEFFPGVPGWKLHGYFLVTE